MTRKTDYTWEDVGDARKADGSATTKTEKEAIAKEWNEANASGGKLDQEQAEILRSTRNTLLSESDWTQGKDVVLSNDAEWKTYRQALRDLPSQSDFPRSVTFPTKPSQEIL